MIQRDSRAACRLWGLVPAAGLGRRMGSEIPKQYLRLLGKTVIEWALGRLASHPAVEGIVVAVSADDGWWEQCSFARRPEIFVVPGGAERSDSVLNGLRRLLELAPPRDWALVHDAARPCLRRLDLEKLVAEACDHPVGGLLAAPISDTVKRAAPDGTVCETLDRRELWRAFTPQMFRIGELCEALERASASRLGVTDEASAMELSGRRPRLVVGHEDNIKITHPADLARAALILRQQEEEDADRAGF